ncbi:hypothetical protein DINM_005545 [Dirofilaria immitis]|nr:hypothetical protein [Dirofilaria immitis]
MHALENLSSIPASRKFRWIDESSSQHVTAIYMDFQDDALIEARKHFGCQNLHGIEADGEDKIHLNEYIYGDELMTPMLSNGRNYLTKISASILEATKSGEKQWYKTNESLVLAETKAYWYGRNWGCIFAERSCYEYIINQLLYREVTKSKEEEKKPKKVNYEKFLGNKRKRLSNPSGADVCFSNRTEFAIVPMRCNIFSYIRTYRTAFGLQAHTLADHFKILSASQFRNFYGSDAIHRFCPFIQEVLYDRTDEIPDGAEIIACDSIRKI